MSAARKLAASRVTAPVVDPSESSLGHSAGLEGYEILSAATDGGFKHICQRDGHHYGEEVLSARSMAKDLKNFIQNPLEVALGGAVVPALDVEYSSSTIKADLLEQLEVTLKANRARGGLSTSVLNCADEIYTNSVYNAPFVNLYTQFNPGVGRGTNSVFLATKHVIRIAAAVLGDRFALMCRDPFGTLDVERFLRRIKTTHEVGPGQAMHFGSGGAGLGSYIIFNECSSLYIAADPGVATVITCVFPLGMSGLQRQSLPKHLHWAAAVKE